MKCRQKLGLGAAFCASMLSLSACGIPSLIYGPPEAYEDSGGQTPIGTPEYSTIDESEDVQAVYGPPTLEDAPTGSGDHLP